MPSRSQRSWNGGKQLVMPLCPCCGEVRTNRPVCVRCDPPARRSPLTPGWSGMSASRGTARPPPGRGTLEVTGTAADVPPFPPFGGPRGAFDVKGDERMANPEELQYNPATSAFNKTFGINPTSYTGQGSNSANSGATVQAADGGSLGSYVDHAAGYLSAQIAYPAAPVHTGDTRVPGQLNEKISGLGPDAIADSGAGQGVVGGPTNKSSEFGTGPTISGRQ